MGPNEILCRELSGIKILMIFSLIVKELSRGSTYSRYTFLYLISTFPVKHQILNHVDEIFVNNFCELFLRFEISFSLVF